VLLRRAANATNLTGELREAAPGGPETVFRYTVVRLWEQPVGPLLSGGLRVLPLAPLAAVTEAELPAVVRRIDRRLDAEAEAGERAKLKVAMYILMGLTWERGLIKQLLRGVRDMKSSVTYQAIIEEGRTEGRAQEARAMILRQGRKKFGRGPTKKHQADLDAITDLARLEALGERLLEVSSWGELLNGA
jgi:predicted transposase YdaD